MFLKFYCQFCQFLPPWLFEEQDDQMFLKVETKPFSSSPSKERRESFIYNCLLCCHVPNSTKLVHGTFFVHSFINWGVCTVFEPRDWPLIRQMMRLTGPLSLPVNLSATRIEHKCAHTLKPQEFYEHPITPPALKQSLTQVKYEEANLMRWAQ